MRVVDYKVEELAKFQPFRNPNTQSPRERDPSQIDCITEVSQVSIEEVSEVPVARCSSCLSIARRVLKMYLVQHAGSSGCINDFMHKNPNLI